MSELPERVGQLEGRMDELYRAFPGGDIDGHRRYHELLQEQIEERRRLRIAVQEKTIAGLVWSGIVGIALACWHYIASGIRGQ